MITMKELGRIRRLYYRDGISLPEIAKKTGHSRNTVKRWLNTPEGVEPIYRRQHHDKWSILNARKQPHRWAGTSPVS
jgi:transposase